MVELEISNSNQKLLLDKEDAELLRGVTLVMKRGRVKTQDGVSVTRIIGQYGRRPKDGNWLDLRKANLTWRGREVGIWWCRRSEKWRAVRNRVSLGYFDTLEEARHALESR